MIQNRVITEYRSERDRSMQPGYISRYDDYYDFEENEATAASPVRETHIDSAQPQPRGPHQPPSNKKAGDHEDDNDSFGAGIL